MAEALVLALVQLPQSLEFSSFVSMDLGANLTVQRLLDRGRVPIIDFGYQYGLLPLLIGRSWFALFGRTPAAYTAAMFVVDLLIAWGLARCAYALRSGPVGIALFICTMISTILFLHQPGACRRSSPDLSCAGRARERPPAACPGDLDGSPFHEARDGLPLRLPDHHPHHSEPRLPGLVRSLVPAALTGILLFVALAAWFGFAVVIQSLLPLRGADSYKQSNYGFFFGIGRRFWLPDAVSARYYIFSPAGHYLVGSVVLFAAAVAAVWRLVRKSTSASDTSTEIVACCGIMHLTFLTLFYADRGSWTYYYYILIIGLAATALRGRGWAILVALITIAALANFKDWGGYYKNRWRDSTRAADTFGLWADIPTREEWRQVRQVIGAKPAVFLTSAGGCLELFMPQFADSEDMFLNPGYPTPIELDRRLKQIAGTEVVLVRKAINVKNFLDVWPEFREALAGFDLVATTERYLIYQRSPENKPSS